MRMKTVLILAVHFPPSGGVGVFRTLKFVKYLPECGWRPVVVTIPAESAKRVSDTSLLREVPADVAVHRPFFFDYRKIVGGDIARLIRPIEQRINFPDKYVHWNRFAFRYIRRRIMPFEKIDLVYASLGPHSTMLLAQRLKRRYNIPFVLDFRDPFSFSQYSLLDDQIRWRRRAEALEASVFRDAAGINHVSPVWKNRYEQLHPAIVGRSTLIYNGYDEDDFTDLGPKTRHACFTVGYNGSFSRLAPPVPLAQAIRTLHERHGIAVRLRLAGPTGERKARSAFAYLFEHGLVDINGFLPHRKSLANLYQSDAAVLVLNDIAATEGMIPAKIFEYMRIGRPVLVLHRRKGYLAELIRRTGTGMAVDIDDNEGIAAALMQLQAAWRRGGVIYEPKPEKIQQFERRVLTRKLAAVFDRLTEGAAGRPQEVHR